jgi:hypothetical protein
MVIHVQPLRMIVAKKGLKIPIPRNMSFPVWVAKVIELYPELQIPVAFSDKNWEDWVKYLFLNQEFAGIPHTNLKEYKDWRAWAEFFISTLT